MEHAPLPWEHRIHRNGHGAIVMDLIGTAGGRAVVAYMPDSTKPHQPGRESVAANADFVVIACNNHDALVAALHGCAQSLRALTHHHFPSDMDALAVADALLASLDPDPTPPSEELAPGGDSYAAHRMDAADVGVEG